MDQLWSVKFTAMMAVPGNQMMTYFGTEEAARTVLDRHAALLSKKLYEESDALVFDDLMGRHSMRVDFFPYCFMYEIAPTEKIWKEINDRIKAIQQEVGAVAKDVGFKGQPAEMGLEIK